MWHYVVMGLTLFQRTNIGLNRVADDDEKKCIQMKLGFVIG